MIFHSFANQEERENFGGTAFMELQYCTLRPETEIKKIVGVGAHKNWMDSSLYIYLDDIESFCLNYGDIFMAGPIIICIRAGSILTELTIILPRRQKKSY